MEFSAFRAQLTQLEERFGALWERKQPEKLQKQATELESQTTHPDFWQDNEAAQQTMRTLGGLKQEIEAINQLKNRIQTLLIDSQDESLANDAEMWQMLVSELLDVEKQIDKLELSTFLAGKFDHSDAIVSIFAGQGGTEAADWAQMLLRMYTRYFNTQGWEVVVLDEVPGTEAGISSVSLEVRGRYAYGLLKHESGTHRLVRNSPFNSAGLRQTSFAGVEVLPVVSEDIEIEVREEDIEVTAVRSSGAGGQNVNKVSSAVRIVHHPSGIVVTCSVNRSQAANRKMAMQMLKAKLYQREQEKLALEKAGLKGEHKEFSWGNQIRNYVLSPYKLVKDLRTDIESNNPDSILDGEIQEFIDAEVRKL